MTPQKKEETSSSHTASVPRSPMLRYLPWSIVIVLLSFFAHRYIYVYSCGGYPESYRNRNVILTGASSGIGAEIAVQLGAAGARIVLAARRKSELETVAALARAAGASDVLVVPTDMTSPSACTELIEIAAAHFGGIIDLLLLNHALSEEYLVAEYNTTEDIEASIGRTIQANLMGSIHAAHAALPYLEKGRGVDNNNGGGGGGHIAVVSSASAKTPAPFHAGYVASKRGLHGFFDTLRHELHLLHSKVTVGILVLGLIATPGITQDEGLVGLAFPVPLCASEMLCSIAARWEESYVPKWYGIVTPFLQLHSGFTEMISNANYVDKVSRYGERIERMKRRSV